MMIKQLFSLMFICGCCLYLPAKELIPGNKQKRNKSEKEMTLVRSDCATATGQIDLEVNNVRVRLRNGGDLWWDGSNGRYIVPKVDAGQEEVSSIYAGGLWLGGIDPAGNLKVAAQHFGGSRGNYDYWPGPLSWMGTTDAQTCANWDQFFKVTNAEIQEHLDRYNNAQSGGGTYTPADIPNGVKGWPAFGNPYFFGEYGFDLPGARQGLGQYFDRNGDARYNPLDGDYPIVSIRGCDTDIILPDEIIFWVFNDAGNIHTESQGDQIGMEIQATAFAYATDDELNNTTFYQYKMINGAIESIDSFYFGQWIDFDLGCSDDDYLGSDPGRSFAYAYNADAVDGNACSCGGIPTYCEDIPAIGYDMLSGLLNEYGDNIGLSAFSYYLRDDLAPSGMEAPRFANEYYHYLTSSWRDGTPLTFGGNGYDLASTQNTRFAFVDYPNNDGWSMCSESLPGADIRGIPISGPVRLDPGAINELNSALVWAPSLEYPCPDLAPLLNADDVVQSLFDNCFQDLNTSTTELSKSNSLIKLSPNPIQLSQFGTTIQIEGMPAKSGLSIFDVTGHLLHKANPGNLTFDGKTTWWTPSNSFINHRSSGLYVLRVELPNGQWQNLKWVIVD